MITWKPCYISANNKIEPHLIIFQYSLVVVEVPEARCKRSSHSIRRSKHECERSGSS
jgi:hypothetical protein